MGIEGLHTIQGVRILAVAEIRGKLAHLNLLALQYKAQCIIHTGNFGFFDMESTKRIVPKTLRHIAMFSPLLESSDMPEEGKEATLEGDALSQLPEFLSGKLNFLVPVYTIYGASEDLAVIEKFKSGTYSVPNLHLIDENTTFRIPTKMASGENGPGIRIFGIGGSLILHRLFDNGDGVSTIAGTPGLMWTTALQIGQLIQTVRNSFLETEIRFFVTHPCPSREGLLLQLATALRADFTLSSGLHFIYGSSFNEFTTQPRLDDFVAKLQYGRSQFMEIWSGVKPQVEALVESNAKHGKLLENTLEVFEKMSFAVDDDVTISAYKNMWHFNLCDVEHGYMTLGVHNGRVGVESISQGFSFDYRHKRANAPIISSVPPTSYRTSPSKDLSKHAHLTKPKPEGPVPVLPTTVPGIWLANGNVTEEEVRSYFDESDAENIVAIVLKESARQPDRKSASVIFNSETNAKAALAKLDREKTGPASLLGVRTRPTGSRSFHSSPRGRGGPRRRGGGGFDRGDRRGSTDRSNDRPIEKSTPPATPSKE